MRRATVLFSLAASCAFVATPAPARLNGMLDAVKVSAASHGFAADLALARAEALRRGSPVVVCQSADGDQCTAAGGWALGWIVFVDADGNGRRGHGEALVLRERAFSRSLRAAGSFDAIPGVVFAPTGAARFMGAGHAEAGSLTVCRTAESDGAVRVTYRPGRQPQVRSEAVADCA